MGLTEMVNSVWKEGPYMFSKFLNLEQEKQNRILNAVIKEFAQKGYANASTNEMVKEAGISKGLLFHYFQNKKQLYFFVYDYCVDLLVKEVLGKINFIEKDFFIRIHQTALVKMELLKKYPEFIKFIEKAYMEDSEKIKREIGERQSKFIKINTKKIFDGIDTSLFKEGVDIQKAINIVTWTFEKMSEEELKRAQHLHEIDYEKVFREADDYIDIFTKWFYKEK